MDYVDINNYSVSFFYLTLQRFMQLVTSPIIYYDEINDTEQYYEIIYIMLYTTQYPVEFLVKYLINYYHHNMNEYVFNKLVTYEIVPYDFTECTYVKNIL